MLTAGDRAFLDSTPELRFVDAFLADLNGVLRGKRLRIKSAAKLFDAGLRLPRSIVGLDIWGEDVLDNGLVLESGDADGLCRPAETGLQPVPWAEQPTAQLLMMMGDTDGSPFPADPRQQLGDMAARCLAQGLRPVTAVELEFYLLSPELDDLGRPAVPPSTGRARRILDGRLYSMGELDAYSAFLDHLYDVCAAQRLPLDSAVVEAGPGQFEINLLHQDDPVRAADHALLLRRAVKAVAGRHGLLASFMAKPFAELAGSGMHVHMSLLDDNGRNVFDDGGALGSDRLREAIGGLLATAPEAMILFAPHLNSMRRFRKSSHAPIGTSWGYDNRTVAIRVPADAGLNRRFEHRIAGADANPYLVVAAILAGLLHGLERHVVPPSATEGNAYEDGGANLPSDWTAAVDGFQQGQVIAPMFGPLFSRVFTACKRQEMRIAGERITDFEYDSYLRIF